MAPQIIDETEPLLAAADIHHVDPLHKTISKDDGYVDPEDPQRWPRSFKWLITSLIFFMAFTVTFNCIAPVPIASRIVEELSGGEPNRYATVLLVTIWELGEASGPLIIAPLSEIFGRYPVLNTCSVLFAAATTVAAMARTTPVMIFSRALSGLVVTSNVLGPAIIGDIFEEDKRGSPMSLVMLAPLIGGAIGPALSGYIAETLHWRWVIWMSVILTTICAVLFLTCFRETYQVAIVRKRERALKKARDIASSETSTITEEAKFSDANELLESIIRPAAVLKSSGILLALSLIGGIAYAHYYNMTTTLPDILEKQYGLSSSAVGASLFCFSIGSVISVIFCNLFLDKVYAQMRDANNGIGLPEFRLPVCIAGGLGLPLTIVLYGWSAQLQLPLPILLISVGLIGMAMLAVEIPLAAYVVDAFGLYSASAMTGLVVTRCLMGTFLPLGAAPLLDWMGYGWGFTALAVVTAGLAPIPVLVMQHGEKWRQLSKYTRVN